MRKTYFNRVPRARVLAVTPSQLRDAFAALAADYKAHLKADGIKLPAERTAKWRQLAVLKHFQGEAVHKDDVSMLIAKLTGKPASDQQVRHLKTQGGWYVLNRGDVYVDGETECWAVSSVKRASILARCNRATSSSRCLGGTCAAL